MNVDPNDPIVKLCAQGIQEEMSGNIIAATELYNKAWQLKTTDCQACIVAHYMARVQTSNEDALHWNLLALQHADKTGENIEAFYPSLYLNVGKSYEDIGNTAEARKHYELGKEKVNLLPDDPLGNLTKEALTRALERVSK
jgi:hypothetical protein